MYTLGDPVNGNDPSGLDDCDSGDLDYGCIADGGYGGTTTDAVCECTVENNASVNGPVYNTGATFSTTATAASPTGFFTSIGNFLNTVTGNTYVQLAATAFVAGVSFAEGNPGPLESAAPDLEAAVGEASDSLVNVVHFTTDVFANLIGRSGTLNAGTWVTFPSQIPTGATAAEIEEILEISAGKGSSAIPFETTGSNLVVPANGPTTSGGAIQFQLKNPVAIDPTRIVGMPFNGRP